MPENKKPRPRRLTIEEILASNDEYGLLDVEPIKTTSSASNSVLGTNFEAINAFIDTNDRVPSKNGELNERQLARRLSGILDSPAYRHELKALDRHNLLPDTAIASDSDLMSSDDHISNSPLSVIEVNDNLMTSNDSNHETNDTEILMAGENAPYSLPPKDEVIDTKEQSMQSTTGIGHASTEVTPRKRRVLCATHTAESNEVSDSKVSLPSRSVLASSEAMIASTYLSDIAYQVSKPSPITDDNQSSFICNLPNTVADQDCEPQIKEAQADIALACEIDKSAWISHQKNVTVEDWIGGYRTSNDNVIETKDEFYDTDAVCGATDSIVVSNDGNHEVRDKVVSAVRASSANGTSANTSTNDFILESDKKVISLEEQLSALADDGNNVTSLDDILNSDAFFEMDFGEDDSIFDMTGLPTSLSSDKANPDEIGRSTHCANFDDFEHIFTDIHNKLASKDMTTARFQYEGHTQEGDIFILDGVICFIDKIGEHRLDNQGRYDPRLRVIFENGTESNILLRTLGKRLYQDRTGRRVVRDAESIVDRFNNVTPADIRTGEVYILTSLSDNPTLTAIPNLVKIGFTKGSVDDRIKNALRDTTFLESPVKVLKVITCYNANPRNLENVIHGFFHAQKLGVSITGKDGRLYRPQEWFSVPLDIVVEVVQRIIDGTIVNYRMDNTTTRLVKKS